MDGHGGPSTGGCPVMHGGLDKNAVVLKMSNDVWWPNRLNLKILHQNAPVTSPLNPAFSYA